MKNTIPQRKDYGKFSLKEQELAGDPMDQFHKWFEEAIEAIVDEPDAMALSTVSSTGNPSSRMVLLRSYSEKGLIFYTNYESRKGQDIRINNKVCLLFYWKEMERQVRVEGKVYRNSRAESREYFETRPLESCVSAIISHQSRVIPGRDGLETKARELSLKGKITIPSYWGGYRVVPAVMEFWQGRPNRLHDRFRYRKKGRQWVIERLAP